MAVEPGLHGEMHVITQCRDRVDRLDDVFGKVARVRGGEADAANSGDGAYRGQKLREGHLAAGIAVGVYVLAQELDLGEPDIGHATGLGEDGG